MNTKPRRRLFTLTFLPVLLLAGCWKKEKPEFSAHPETRELMPTVREGVARNMRQMFGTYDAMQLPQAAPVHWSGHKGEVVSLNQTEEGRTELRVEPPASSLSETSILHFLLKDEQGRDLPPYPVEIAEVDAKSGTIQIDENLPEEILEGTGFQIPQSHQLKLGQALYRKNCYSCHGINGAGDGPQSQVLNPKPRDFRRGIFKYTSTQIGQKAREDDLNHVIKTGIAGTGMPAFKLLGRQEVGYIADYVKYLALRGEVEQSIAMLSAVDFSQEMREEFGKELEEEASIFVSEDLPYLFEDEADRLFEQWREADLPGNVLLPASDPPEPLDPSKAAPDVSSVLNGKRIFLSKEGQCSSCHGESGQGDGEQTRKFQKKTDGSLYEEPGLHDDWGHVVKPRNLAYGVFHGGRKPLDLYRRIYAGVKGTPMPAYGTSGLGEAEIWDLVNYMLYLGGEYPEISDDQLR